MKLLLAFTFAAYNLETIRSFTAKKEVDEARRRRSLGKKRRTQTWTDLSAVIARIRPLTAST